MVIACLLLTASVPRTCVAAGPFNDPRKPVAVFLPTGKVENANDHREPQRLVAATLDLTLGAFGAHRLYFGTDAKVPVLYGITFGGFGILVVIDLAHILFTKDLTPYRDNHQVFMWAKGHSPELTPP